MPVLLVVGDSRAAEWRPERRMAINWDRKIRFERHATLNRMGVMVWEELDADTNGEIQGVMVVGLTDELTTRVVHAGQQGYLRTSPLLSVCDLYNVITSFDRAWRTKYHLTVLWILPATPDFLKFNIIMAERQGITMNAPDRTEAVGYELTFTDGIKQLAGRLSIQKLFTFVMQPAPRSDADDGYHYRAETLKCILGNAEELFMNKVPQEPPYLLGPSLKIQQRWAKAQRRKRYRLQRAQGAPHFELGASEMVRRAAAAAVARTRRDNAWCDRSDTFHQRWHEERRALCSLHARPNSSVGTGSIASHEPVHTRLTYPPGKSVEHRQLSGRGRPARMGAVRVMCQRLGAPLGTSLSPATRRSRYQFALNEPALEVAPETRAPAPWQQRNSSRGSIEAQPTRTVRDRLAPPETMNPPVFQDWETYIPSFNEEFWDNMTL